MNYASRLGLVHFTRRDPNGIRRDPGWGVRGVVFLASVLCALLAGSDGIRGDAMSRKFPVRRNLPLSVWLYLARILSHDEEGNQGYETLEPHAS